MNDPITAMQLAQTQRQLEDTQRMCVELRRLLEAEYATVRDMTRQRDEMIDQLDRLWKTCAPILEDVANLDPAEIADYDISRRARDVLGKDRRGDE